MLDDVGGPEGLLVDGRPATVLAAGSPQAIDLAVLRLPGLPGEPLPLLAENGSPADDGELRIVGFQSFGVGQQLLHPLSARLGEPAVIGQAERSARARAWWLQVTGERGLEPGFSGAAALSVGDGKVVGVVSMRQGASAGLAIAIGELRRAWEGCPDAVFARPGLAPAPAPADAAPARLSDDAAAAAGDLLDQLRATLPDGLRPHLDDLAATLLPTVAATLAAGERSARVPISQTGAAALAALAGRELQAGSATVEFGADGQYGDVRIGNAVSGNQINLSLYLGEGAAPAPAAPALTPPATSAGPVTIVLGAGVPDEAYLALRLALEARGLRVTRRASAPGLGEEALRADLDASCAAVALLAPQSFGDPALYSFVLPALRELRAGGARPALLGLIGADAEQLPIRADVIASVTCGLGAAGALHSRAVGELAGETLLAARLPGLGAVAARGEATVEVMAHPDAAARPGADIVLDWVEHFRDGPASDETSAELLLPALQDLKRLLRAAGAETIALRGDARLSVGFALGYVFRESTGFTLRVQQRADWWPSDGPAYEAPLRLDGDERTPEGGPDMTIELSSARQPIEAAARAWLDRHPGVVGRRWRATVTEARLDGPMALAVARLVSDALVTARRSEQLPGTIHLMGAMPLGLAALIGWHLNTCEPVQCYDAIAGNSDYQAACRFG